MGEPAPQAAAPDVRQGKRLKQTIEQPEIAESRDKRSAGLCGGLHRQGENLRVRGFPVNSPEALKAGLGALAAALGPSAKDRAEVGELGRPSSPVRGEIGAADRDRIFRPETELLARRPAGQEQAAANLLPRHVKEDRRRMKEGRLKTHEAGREEMLQSPLSDAPGGPG